MCPLPAHLSQPGHHDYYIYLKYLQLFAVHAYWLVLKSCLTNHRGCILGKLIALYSHNEDKRLLSAMNVLTLFACIAVHC